MSAQQLAERVSRFGIAWDRSIVANLETGRRAVLSVEEMLALAVVLDVAPVHLLVPTVDDQEPYLVTPQASPVATRGQVRHWVRGFCELPGRDPRKYFTEVPMNEFGIGETQHLAWPPRGDSDG
jgi:hypothetical protein